MGYSENKYRMIINSFKVRELLILLRTFRHGVVLGTKFQLRKLAFHLKKNKSWNLNYRARIRKIVELRRSVPYKRAQHRRF